MNEATLLLGKPTLLVNDITKKKKKKYQVRFNFYCETTLHP